MEWISIEKPWDWNKINNDFWQIPSDEVYYYLYNWKLKKNRKILDLGCGLGRHSILFASHKFDVTAFDISESGLNKLKQLSKDLGLPIKLVLGNMIKLPFLDNNFDYILAYNSIYHTDSFGIQKVIDEMERVLEPEGEIFLTFLSKQNHFFSFLDENMKIDDHTALKKEEDGSELPHYFVNYNDILDLLKNFKILKIKHIESFYNNKSDYHYYVHAKKEQKRE